MSDKKARVERHWVDLIQNQRKKSDTRESEHAGINLPIGLITIYQHTLSLAYWPNNAVLPLLAHITPKAIEKHGLVRGLVFWY